MDEMMSACGMMGSPMMGRVSEEQLVGVIDHRCVDWYCGRMDGVVDLAPMQTQCEDDRSMRSMLGEMGVMMSGGGTDRPMSM